MNNEPVAYLVKAPDGEYLVFEKSKHPVMADCTYIPLYTHPVKELTDEEMYELLEKYQGIELCKAILRKAQEK